MATYYNDAAGTQYHHFADNPAIKSGAGSFSIFVRIYFVSTINVQDRFINKGNSSGGSYGGVRYEFISGLNNTVEFVVDDNVTKSTTISPRWTAPTDQWLDVILTRDGGSTISIHSGSTLITSATDSTGNIDTTATLVFGAGRDAGDTISDPANCRIQEVAYVGRVSTAAERAAYGQGYSALFFEPDAYFNLTRVPLEWVAGIALSGTGSTPSVVEDPPVIYPEKKIIVRTPIDATSSASSASSLSSSSVSSSSPSSSSPSSLSSSSVSSASSVSSLSSSSVSSLSSVSSSSQSSVSSVSSSSPSSVSSVSSSSVSSASSASSPSSSSVSSPSSSSPSSISSASSSSVSSVSSSSVSSASSPSSISASSVSSASSSSVSSLSSSSVSSVSSASSPSSSSPSSVSSSSASSVSSSSPSSASSPSSLSSSLSSSSISSISSSSVSSVSSSSVSSSSPSSSSSSSSSSSVVVSAPSGGAIARQVYSAGVVPGVDGVLPGEIYNAGPFVGEVYS